MEDIWKDIIMKDVDYTGYYQVSTYGRVRSLDRIICDGRKYAGKIMKQRVMRGYWYVCLTKDGIHKSYRVHRLVAETFIPNPDNKPEVGHKDEKNFNTSNECNNNVENLEWVTPKENNNQPMRRTRGPCLKLARRSCGMANIAQKKQRKSNA